MLLDQLVETIEKLKSRIQDHRDVLQRSEAQTRLSLIDPLLRALGWDIEDPAMVTPEYVLSGKRADYALLNGQGQVVVFLEAKRLDEQLSTHRSQVAGYASELGIRYPALTNGDQWEVYDNKEMVPIEQRRILNTSIADNPSAKCALQFLLLWRPNMALDQPMEVNEPLLGTKSEPPTPPPPPVGWTALNGSFDPVNKPAPKSMKLPNGHRVAPKSWKDIIIQTALWLHQTGYLTKENCQLLSWETAKAKADRYILSRDGKHPDSTDFLSPYRIGDDIVLETHLSSRAVITRTIRLLEHCGQDPSQLLLQLA